MFTFQLASFYLFLDVESTSIFIESSKHKQYDVLNINFDFSVFVCTSMNIYNTFSGKSKEKLLGKRKKTNILL